MSSPAPVYNPYRPREGTLNWIEHLLLISYIVIAGIIFYNLIRRLGIRFSRDSWRGFADPATKRTLFRETSPFLKQYKIFIFFPLFFILANYFYRVLQWWMSGADFTTSYLNQIDTAGGIRLINYPLEYTSLSRAILVFLGSIRELDSPFAQAVIHSKLYYAFLLVAVLFQGRILRVLGRYYNPDSENFQRVVRVSRLLQPVVFLLLALVLADRYILRTPGQNLAEISLTGLFLIATLVSFFVTTFVQALFVCWLRNRLTGEVLAFRPNITQALGMYKYLLLFNLVLYAFHGFPSAVSLVLTGLVPHGPGLTPGEAQPILTEIVRWSRIGFLVIFPLLPGVQFALARPGTTLTRALTANFQFIFGNLVRYLIIIGWALTILFGVDLLYFSLDLAAIHWGWPALLLEPFLLGLGTLITVRVYIAFFRFYLYYRPELEPPTGEESPSPVNP